MKVILTLLGTFAIGVSFIFATNEKYLIRRDPAAIRQSYDFTNLRGTALEVAMRDRIVSQIEIVKNEEGFGLSLGNFAFKADNGQDFFSCQYFSKIIMVFEAEGVAVSGSKPTMEVAGPCQSSEDLTKISALMIPMSKLMLEKPQDGDINFNEASLSLHFLNLPDSWPTQWNLIGIRMESQQQQFIIDRNEIAQIIGQQLLITTE
ncbi:MAG: hypothetical protein KDD45_11480 [Bdellovibrionales bacterium]|nr:hypothetical protein [Bdellovibrionales bacterium]